MRETGSSAPLRMLIINPNTSQPMTDALKPMVVGLGYANVEYTFFTSPTPGIPSINSPADAAASASICLPHLVPLVSHHDAFLIACYSAHPLVPQLRAEIDNLPHRTGSHKLVTGIFEASVSMSLTLLSGLAGGVKFGIVSTGKIWETALAEAVEEFLHIKCHGREGGGRFLGVETTGLSAVELHDLPPEEVRQKMKEAAQRLCRWGDQAGADGRGVGVVVLGCAGMVGLEGAVREGVKSSLGEERGSGVKVVDGVKAGVGELVGCWRGDF